MSGSRTHPQTLLRVTRAQGDMNQTEQHYGPALVAYHQPPKPLQTRMRPLHDPLLGAHNLSCFNLLREALR